MKGYESTISSPDNLRAGPSDWITEECTVASGEGELPRGAVLGKITASGEMALVNSAGENDGRRTAVRILLEDIDATDEAVVTMCLRAGEVNGNSLEFGGTDTVATHKSALDAVGIIVRNAVEA